MNPGLLKQETIFKFQRIISHFLISSCYSPDTQKFIFEDEKIKWDYIECQPSQIFFRS